MRQMHSIVEWSPLHKPQCKRTRLLEIRGRMSSKRALAQKQWWLGLTVSKVP
jgi:hypothetical protein